MFRKSLIVINAPKVSKNISVTKENKSSHQNPFAHKFELKNESKFKIVTFLMPSCLQKSHPQNIATECIKQGTFCRESLHGA